MTVRVTGTRGGATSRMPSRRALGIGIALVALALAWAVRGSCARARDALPAASASPRADGREPSPLDAGIESLDAPSSALAAARESAAPFVHEPAYGNDILFLFVDEAGHALPRTNVRVLDPRSEDGDVWPGDDRFDGELALEVEARGAAHSSDDAGRLRLARFESSTALVARAGALVAYFAFGPDDMSPRAVTLRPNHVLDVRVRDADGAPVAGVVLELDEPPYRSPLWRGTSADDGRARIESFPIARSNPGEVLRLRARIAQDSPVERWLPSDFACAQPIELVLPRSRTVELRIVDEHRGLVPIDGRLELSFEQRESDRPRTLADESGFTVALHAGRARIAGFAEDSPSFWVNLEDAPASWRVDPRLLPPEHARIDLELEADVRLARLRVLAPSGEALARRRLQCWKHYEPQGERATGSRFSRLSFVTDDEGRALVVLPTARDEDEFHHALVVDRVEKPPLAVEVPQPSASSASGVEELEITLRPLELALEGRVVTERGVPVARAQVKLAQLGPDSARDLETLGPVRTGDDGRFTAWSWPISGSMAASVEREDHRLSHLDGDRSFPAGSVQRFGARNVELHVATGAELDAWLAVDAPWLDGGVLAELFDGDDWIADGVVWREGELLHVRFAELAAGARTLRITTPAGGRVEVENVLTDSEGVARDARLEPLDLRGKLGAPGDVADVHLPRLRLQDEHGVALEHGFSLYEVDGDWHSPFPWLGGSVTVLPIFERLAAWSPGRSLVIGPAPRADATWTLPPARVVTLHVELPASVRAAAVELRARAHLASDSNQPLHMILESDAHAAIDAAGDARFELPGAARWEFSVSARWKNGERQEEHDLQTLVLDLADDSSPTRRALLPDEASWLEQLHQAGAPFGSR